MSYLVSSIMLNLSSVSYLYSVMKTRVFDTGLFDNWDVFAWLI